MNRDHSDSSAPDLNDLSEADAWLYQLSPTELEVLLDFCDLLLLTWPEYLPSRRAFLDLVDSRAMSTRAKLWAGLLNGHARMACRSPEPVLRSYGHRALAVGRRKLACMANLLRERARGAAAEGPESIVPASWPGPEVAEHPSTRLPELDDREYVCRVHEAVLGRGCRPSELRRGLELLFADPGGRETIRRQALRERAAQEQGEAAYRAGSGADFHIMGTERFVTVADWAARAREIAADSGAASAVPPVSAGPYIARHLGRPRVSVITSLYRGGPYIERFLANMQAQTCFRDDAELLVVDAASPDGEAELIKERAREYPQIRLIRSTETIGIYAAWNIAVAEARGDYLTNANVDDLRREDSLALQADALDRWPEVDVVYQDFYYTMDPTLSYEQVAAFGYLSALPDGPLGALPAAVAPRAGSAFQRAEALYQELEAMASLDSEALGLEGLEQAAAAAELTALRADLASARQAGSGLAAELAELRRSADAETAALRATLAEREAALAEARAAQAAGSQDAELQQIQLHQLREELESLLAMQRDEAGQRQSAEQAAAAATAEREAQAAQLAEERSRAQAAAEEAAAVRWALGQREAELAAERERLSGLDEALAAARSALAERDQQLAAARAERDARAAELAQARETGSSSAQEAELLLLQLHQVQEEFEALFLKQRDEGNQLQAAEQARSAALAERDARSAELQQLRAERDALAAALQQVRGEHEAQASALQLARAESEARQRDRQRLEDAVRQLDQALHTARMVASDSAQQAADRTRTLASLTGDSEQLLRQLHQAREELVRFAAAAQATQVLQDRQGRQARRLRQWLNGSQPETVALDLRRDIDGEGWHEAESDGRWTGPEPLSLLRLPALLPGPYLVQLDVVDAIAADILAGATVSLCDRPVPIDAIDAGLPVRLGGVVDMPDTEALEWPLELRTPRVLAPSALGIADDRPLGLRVRGVTLTRLA